MDDVCLHICNYDDSIGDVSFALITTAASVLII